jgi:hypothetical protein
MMRWTLQFLILLPRSWQDWYIRRVLKRLKIKTPEQVVV